MSNKPLAYYPGCSALGSSLEYDLSTRAVCHALGLRLRDIPDWSCCGSTPAHTVDRALAAALSARNLSLAEEMGLSDIATPCPSCLKNLKAAVLNLEDPRIAPEALRLLGKEVRKKHNVRSVLQVIHEDIGPEAIARKLRKPLSGIKLVPYYGCLLSRPTGLMTFDNEEYPLTLDNILEALGATVLPFPLKVECCGASMGITRNEAVTRQGGRILDLAASLGAEAIVAACPLCQMNLDLRQSQIERAGKKKYAIPVFYYTQLLGLSLGLYEEDLGLDKLIVNPEPILQRIRALPLLKETKTAPGEEAS